MAATSRKMLLQGRLLSSRLLVGASQKPSNPLASRHLQSLESDRHVSTSLRYLSGLASRPLPQAWEFSTNVRLNCVRGMSAEASAEAATKSDIIARIKHDHEELEEFYTNYKRAHQRGDEEEAYRWFNQFVWEISRHAVSEELVLYPLIETKGQRGSELANQSRTDHQQTKDILEELQRTTDPDLFEQRMDKMMAELREHIRKEESEDLVYLKEHVSQDGREAAGTAFSLGKTMAPTRPHASVPNKSVAIEAALGLLLTPMDKLRDIFTPFPTKN